MNFAKRNRHEQQTPMRGLLALTLLAFLCSIAGASAASVRASEGTLVIPTYPWSAVPHPYFRGTDGRNIYPYPMLDNLNRTKEPRTYRTVVLENEYLRITFLPELGGKIHEVLDKTTGQPMFYVNHVIKPGLIGQCGAWISGGVEWNTGPQGHTVSCVQPIDVVTLPPAPDGSRSVAIGETERVYRTKWTVIVTLRPGRSFIEERIRIYNPTETVRPYYFWNCTAAPNTKGFRFIYPMTLGTDHGAEKFFNWPIDHGKDLSRGTNYQDASSIFAWHCDQDFFGSYNDDLDRGVVAYANHHQLPGKKAWTWGYGGYGTMHQMDLTDDDGPYNEVQTGPLLTQGEVGRLDPCEAVEWQEWWYPIHRLGGFTFANRDVAVNAVREGAQVNLRLLGTGTWPNAQARLSKGPRQLASVRCQITPRKPTELSLSLGGEQEPVDVEISLDAEGRDAGPATVLGSRRRQTVLARFQVPLALPVRQPPEKQPAAETATELAQAGWQEFLFAKFKEAEQQFHKSLEKDAKGVEARVGLAHLNLDRDPAGAVREANAALAVDPGNGLARYACAVAEYRLGHEAAALDHAWKAALDPKTAGAARILAAKLYLRRGDFGQAHGALAEPGPWQTDPTGRNYLALASLQAGEKAEAVRLATLNLALDPLDTFARSLLWLANAELKELPLRRMIAGDAYALLELLAAFSEVGHERIARQALDQLRPPPGQGVGLDPLLTYWRTFLASRDGEGDSGKPAPRRVSGYAPAEVNPHQRELEPVLRWVLTENPNDGQASLWLGHLLFHLGRHDEGRKLWARAAELGFQPAMAYRALGVAARNLDNNLETAADLLRRGHQADPADAIIARDLASVLFALADKAGSAEATRELTVQVRDALKTAYAGGKGRSDFVALLARAQNRLGEFAETARLLDAVRITIWEGAREAHDLFEEAHLALGTAHLDAGRAKEALAEFDRALEYPANLATGKLENAREAHIHYLRGNALAALGQKEAAVAAWKQAAEEPASRDSKKEQARRDARQALERMQ